MPHTQGNKQKASSKIVVRHLNTACRAIPQVDKTGTHLYEESI